MFFICLFGFFAYLNFAAYMEGTSYLKPNQT